MATNGATFGDRGDWVDGFRCESVGEGPADAMGAPVKGATPARPSAHLKLVGSAEKSCLVTLDLEPYLDVHPLARGADMRAVKDLDVRFISRVLVLSLERESFKLDRPRI